MSFGSALKGLKSLRKIAWRYKKLTSPEGESTDADLVRIRKVATEFLANWEVVAQYEDDIKDVCDDGSRSQAQERRLKLFSKDLKIIEDDIDAANANASPMAVTERMWHEFEKIGKDIKTWKGWVAKARKRKHTASAEPGASPRGAGAKKKTKGKQQALA